MTRLASPSKYANRFTAVDGIRFRSAAEARRYQHLRLLERVGEVIDLELQPVYVIRVNDTIICRYYADFRYRNVQGETVVEDVKGMRTALYKLKKKLVEAQYGIRITEVA